MLLVVDANVLFSALIAGDKTSDLIFSDWLRLITPEYLFTELEEHEKEIKEKSKLSKEDFTNFLDLIESRIDVIPKEKFEKFLPKANQISPDPDDTEYFALALKFDTTIWTDDKRLKKQNQVEIISTKELIEHLKTKK